LILKEREMIIRSKAPLRISFGGGGTDVSPYAEEKVGNTLSATIDKYAYCTLTLRDDNLIKVHSLDYDIVASYQASEDLTFDGRLDLVKSALRVIQVNNGLNIFTHSDMPPGSGLGSSSALTVALVGALTHYMKIPLDDYDIAELAFRIERQEMGIKGGKQDQYASAFGFFNFTEYYGDRVIVNPLRINEDIVNELQYRLLLCFTGKTRLSAGIIDDQITRYIQGNEDTIKGLDESKNLAIAMKNALLLKKIDEFGQLLHEAWLAKRKFTPKITNDHIDEMYEVARKNGAVGGKLLGAGGGGYLLLFCQFDKRHLVSESLEKIGGKIVGFSFEYGGLKTWETDSKFG
jgi:D-glycero-alpha-D-manno-heptose-7-phosphate kinase